MWWAGNEDSGWGLSLAFVQRDNHQEIVVVLYFHDAEGNPRWLIGQQAGFTPAQAITVNMRQINGYGRLQNFVELTELPAGTIELTLNQASMNLGIAGTANINVAYQGTEGGNWIRNNIPVALFSKPKN